jgi:DNA-binding CsgD family transcriptional regulator
MGESKASPRKVRKEARALQALQMRIEAATYQEIADALHITKSSAWTLVKHALDDLKKEVHEEAEHARAAELIRLDNELAALWPACVAGDVQAIDCSLRISKRRSDLLGLDAATKSELSGPGGGPLTNPFAALTVEQLRKLADDK